MEKINVTRYEQEVHVSFTMEDEMATLYTSSTVWLKKMDKIVKAYPDQFKVVDTGKINGEIISKTYEFPIKYFKILKPRKELSDERKQELKERLASFKK